MHDTAFGNINRTIVHSLVTFTWDDIFCIINIKIAQ